LPSITDTEDELTLEEVVEDEDDEIVEVAKPKVSVTFGLPKSN
jgi:hypothetical protein